MERNHQYDLLVLGAGPGGYVAAIRASQLGLKVGIIEKDKPGGVCLNIGCIPSKALIHQAELYQSIGSLEKLGLRVDIQGFDYKKVYEKSRKAADTLSKGVQFLLKKNKIDLIPGEGIITGKNEITLKDGRRFTGKSLLIATGSSPKAIPIFPFDEETVLSSTGALMLQQLPKKLIILGAGAIGVEFAHIMNAFGVEVYLVEMMDHILPLEDQETVEVLARSFKKRGIHILTSSKALAMEKMQSQIQLTLEKKDGTLKKIEADKMLVSVGRTPNTGSIGLENIGIQTDRGFIPVGDYYQTRVPGIYAIGDVISSPLLAHVASKEGEIAAEHIAGLDPLPQIDPRSIPGAVYAEPQIGSFGYTERELKEKDIPYSKSLFPYRGAGKSVAVEQPEGLVKLLYSPDIKEILGAHVVGAEATELIHELLLAKTAELLPEDIAATIHAHPTLSEAVMEAARAAEGWAIHI